MNDGTNTGLQAALQTSERATAESESPEQQVVRERQEYQKTRHQQGTGELLADQGELPAGSRLVSNYSSLDGSTTDTPNGVGGESTAEPAGNGMTLGLTPGPLKQRPAAIGGGFRSTIASQGHADLGVYR